MFHKATKYGIIMETLFGEAIMTLEELKHNLESIYNKVKTDLFL